MRLCLSSVCWISALVHSAAITKCHRQAGLQTTEIYFENSGGWKSKIQDRGRVQSDERALLVHHQALLAVTPTGGKETELSGVSSRRRDWSGAWGLHGRRRITSSMTCFLIPLPWSLGFADVNSQERGGRYDDWEQSRTSLIHLHIIYLPIMYLSFYLAISLSSISLSLSPFIHPSIPHIYPFISPVYQSAIHSSFTYLPIISILICLFIYSSTHSSIPLIYPSRYPIYHPYLSIYLSPLSTSLSSISLSLYPLIHPPIRLIYPFICPIHLSYLSIICLPTYPPIYPSIYLSHPSFYLFVQPFFHSTYVSHLSIICLFLSLIYVPVTVFSTFPSEHTEPHTGTWIATTFPNPNVPSRMTLQRVHVPFPLGSDQGTSAWELARVSFHLDSTNNSM